MGQFDLETDAALAQLSYEAISKTPGGEFVEIVSDLLALTGIAGPLATAGGASSLLLKIRKLAGAGYASNLIYAITSVRNDLADLYAKHAELRERIESLRDDPKFAEAIAALALRTMHTSVPSRLTGLARIVVNCVKANDLNSERLDDMMRAEAELKEDDLWVLGMIADKQVKLLENLRFGGMDWLNGVRATWRDLEEEGRISTDNFIIWRSSLARLQAHGFVESLGRSSSDTGSSPWLPHYALMPEGKMFLDRIQELDK